MLAVDEEVDDVGAVLSKRRLDLHEAQLVREQRKAERGGETEQAEASLHFGSSNDIDAHQLSQSTPASAGAASMCTALITQKPACASRSVARPFASVRTRTALSGSSLLMATISTFAIGLPRNARETGSSPAACIAYGFFCGTSSRVKPIGASNAAAPGVSSSAFAQR